jgi:parallel beta-helix repeat protein
VEAALELCPTSLNAYHVVTATDVDNTGKLDGFTITGGRADGNLVPNSEVRGGGIVMTAPLLQADQPGPIIARSRLVNNRAVYGGGLSTQGAPAAAIMPSFVNLEFRDNFAILDVADAGGDGGGAWSGARSRELWVNCLLVNNTAAGNGGGLYMETGTEFDITNCTFVENSADGLGDGIYLDEVEEGNAIETTVANSILWKNGGPQAGADDQLHVVLWGTRNVTLATSDVQGGIPSNVDDGGGNKNDDPWFANPAAGNYRLKACSPCVETANNDALPPDVADLDQDLNTIEGTPVDLDITNARVIDSPDNGDEATVDMGAYEFLPAPCPWDCAVPANGQVDTVDFFQLIAEWGLECTPCDQTGGPGVDVVDFFALIAASGPCSSSATSGPPGPSLQEQIANVGLTWPDDWDAFVNVMRNGTEAEQENYRCWMLHYLSGDCLGALCVPLTCLAADPFSRPPIGHILVP